MALKIAQGISLPTDAVTQVFGIVARRGRGKTYTGSVMAEEMIREHLPFVVLDPLGAWWGLRSSADGQKPGLKVVILGGEHQDIPLEPHTGRLVADFVVANPGHYILDMSGFDSNAAQDRFAGDFAERLYRAKATNRAALHLFVDEADSFAPQMSKGRERMLGAFEALARRGRIRGIGMTLITQRPASLNKNVLTQVECLITLQITGPHDRNAVDDWVKQYGEPEQRTAFLASLASLAVGEAWVWSPSWLATFKRVKIRKRRTFDSGKTPEAGDELTIARSMAAVNIDALAEAMAETIERAQRDDPELLRAKIADLERELARRPKEAEVVERIVEVPVLPPEIESALPELIRWEGLLKDGAGGIGKTITLLRAAATRPKPKPPRLVEVEPREGTAAVRTTAPSAHRPSASSRSATSEPLTRIGSIEESPPSYGTADGETVPLKAGARRMLEVAARHHPMRVTKSQFATLVGMKVTGGTFLQYLSALKRNGYIEQDDKLYGVTPEGLAFAGVEARPMTTDEVLETWRSALKAGARRILDVLVEVYPTPLTREELAQRVQMEPTGGTFLQYVGTLRRNGLAETEDGVVVATATVMGR